MVPMSKNPTNIFLWPSTLWILQNFFPGTQYKHSLMNWNMWKQFVPWHRIEERKHWNSMFLYMVPLSKNPESNIFFFFFFWERTTNQKSLLCLSYTPGRLCKVIFFLVFPTIISDIGNLEGRREVSNMKNIPP